MRFFTPNNNFWAWAEALPKNEIVIEVGCGQGELVREMLQKDIKAIGVDPRANLLNEKSPWI